MAKKMKRAPSASLKPFIQAAQAAGWSVSLTKGGHVLFKAPVGARVYAASTPSGGKRSDKNLRAALRRAGLKL